MFLKKKDIICLLCGLFLAHTLHATAFKEASQHLRQILSETRGNKQKTLEAFYEKNGYQPIWFDEHGWKKRQAVAIDVLRHADTEGLNPAEYTQNIHIDTAVDVPSICQQEITLTRHILNYMDDIKGDRFDPRKLHKDIDFPARQYDAALAFYDLLQKDETLETLKDFTLTHPEYQKLKALLAKLSSEKNETPDPIPSGKLLKKGMIDPRVISVKKRLQVASEGPAFDETLESVLKIFQKIHGMTADGTVGERTLKMLNQSLDDKRAQIMATMEKWRWIPENHSSRYIMVNIPAFKLTAYTNNIPDLSIRVIIGQAYRHTPIFMSVVDAISFNPLWHVPHSIAVQDKLPLLQRDPEQLSRKGFRVYTEDRASMDPTAINWSQISADSFPYRLVQNPGSANALGKIRFNIPSKFSVYLHSTPDRSLFAKDVRNFSSGCIRIEKPDEMGMWILNDPQKWPLSNVQKAMEGTETRIIKLNDNVPIFITYFTVWFDDQDQAIFADDIYDQDRVLIAAMNTINSPAMIRD